MLTDPVKICWLVKLLPKILLPELYSTEELIVLTTKVCATRLEVTVKDPVIDWSALKLLEPVVTYTLSICVSLVETDPEETATEAVVAKAKDPVPSNKLEFEAVPLKLPERKVKLPDMVTFPVKVVLPVTVKDPDMTGEYMFMLCYSYAGF